MWYGMVRSSTVWYGLVRESVVCYGDVRPALGVESILLAINGTIDYLDRPDIKWGFVS